MRGREGEGEGREGTGQVVQGLVGHGEDLGFLPKKVEGGSPGGLCAEEGLDLTQVFTCATWWLLWGRQTERTRTQVTVLVQVGH